MTRPPTGAPGRPRRLVTLAASVTLLLAACGSAQETAAPTASNDATASPASSAGQPSAAPASDDLASPDPGTATPSPAPSAPVEASPSLDGGPAADCTGTDKNRMFFGSVATAVEWTVYCPVLPNGWFVEAGQYRLANGGWLAIAYRGPGGARFSLDEGAWCSDGTGCVPAGSGMGTTAFGDLTGTLIATSDGNFAISVDAGSPVSWLLTGDGLDEATIRTFGAALIAVGN